MRKATGKHCRSLEGGTPEVRPGRSPVAAMRLRWRSLFAAVILLTLSSVALSAKEKEPRRVLSGIVSDGAENPVVGAAVTLTDLQTGKKTATYTSSEGAYQFSDLQFTRDYEVQAAHKGVSSQVRRVSTIDPRTKIVFNLRIPPPKEEE